MKLMSGREEYFVFGDIDIFLQKILIYSKHILNIFLNAFKILLNFVRKFLIIKDRIFNGAQLLFEIISSDLKEFIAFLIFDF